MEGGLRRMISFSFPSGKIITGFEPVVFAKTENPAWRSIEVSILVTLDFPRAPVIQIRKGI
jgi:hypothetical protein